MEIQKQIDLVIRGTGCYLPERVVTSLELDERFHLPAGTYQKASGVKSRRYASAHETSSFMGARAAMMALERAHLRMSDIDFILGACGTPEQAIPSTAALIQRELGAQDSGIPCFDINSTCLSFLTAFQMAGHLIQSGGARNILIVSSDIASVGLNYRHLEAASLFGDGAAAIVVGVKSSPDEVASQILGFHMETYSSGWDTCQIAAGGSKLHPSRLDWRISDQDERFLFQMDGPKVFELASKKLPEFVNRLENKSGRKLADASLVIPHQASASALYLIRRRLQIDSNRFFQFIEEHGNMIAASLPLGLHYALEQKRIQQGETVCLLGTSAGFSMGGLMVRL